MRIIKSLIEASLLLTCCLVVSTECVAQDGSLDLGFGNGGIIITPVEINEDDEANAVEVQ